jgi:phage/plasmid-associated DNA primase
MRIIMACIFADLPDLVLEQTGTFKMLTGRDLITPEKKFKNSFPFENFAKLCFLQQDPGNARRHRRILPSLAHSYIS